MTKSVFITRPLPREIVELFPPEFKIKMWEHKKSPTKEDIISLAKDSNALLSMLTDDLSESVLKSLKNLEVIANLAVGYNNIDINYCKNKDLKVGNTPGVLSAATADLALSLLLNLTRHTFNSVNDVKNGIWPEWGPLTLCGDQLDNKTLGIIGMGRIGQNFAKKCQLLWNMEVIYYNRNERFDLDFPAKLVTLTELYERSDVISLHCPLTKQTERLLNLSAFSKMKKRPYIINTSRGEVIDQEALYQALKDKNITAAGLDVTTPEPIKNDSPLVSLQNVIITPHIGSATKETRLKMMEMSVKNIISGLRGEELPFSVY